MVEFRARLPKDEAALLIAAIECREGSVWATTSQTGSVRRRRAGVSTWCRALQQRRRLGGCGARLPQHCTGGSFR